MPRVVKYLLGALGGAALAFLFSLGFADEFTLVPRLVVSVIVGAVFYGYFVFLEWWEKRRPPEPPYQGEDEDT